MFRRQARERARGGLRDDQPRPFRLGVKVGRPGRAPIHDRQVKGSAHDWSRYSTGRENARPFEGSLVIFKAAVLVLLVLILATAGYGVGREHLSDCRHSGHKGCGVLPWDDGRAAPRPAGAGGFDWPDRGTWGDQGRTDGFDLRGLDP